MKYQKFSNGDQMPIIGLGTWKSAPGEVYEVIREAIRLGYRHFDCAHIYGNEKEIGQALKDAMTNGDVKRKELWITSKLWNDSHLLDDVVPALETTLKNLQLDYLDLYLVHWPLAVKKGVNFAKSAEDYLTPEQAPLIDTWTGMEECFDEELTRHIGVSNCNIKTLTMLMREGTLPPEVNQVELHPYLPQIGLYDFCKEMDIFLTAYSPLGSGDRNQKAENEPLLLRDEAVAEISQKHGCTPAQTLLAWAVMRDTSVIPKSTNPERLKENLAAVDIQLDRDDLRKLSMLRKFRFINGNIFTQNGSPYKLTDLWDY